VLEQRSDREGTNRSFEDPHTWVHERSHEAATGCINVNGSIQATLDQQVVDGLDILILACVSGSEDATDAFG
jgi:hypothetical protein